MINYDDSFDRYKLDLSKHWYHIPFLTVTYNHMDNFFEIQYEYTSPLRIPALQSNPSDKNTRLK